MKQGDVELTIEGPPVALPAGIDLSAYRIVQEALTNSLKHANGARACVTVRYDNSAVEIEVQDDGQTAANGNGSGSGHGLVGMRERVALWGGALTAERDEIGWTVRARLPISGAQ